MMRYYKIALVFAIAYVIACWFAIPSCDAYPTTDDSRIAKFVSQASVIVPMNNLNVKLVVAPCPGMSNASCNLNGVIYIHPDTVTPNTVSHELGHAWDNQYLFDGARAKITNRFFNLPSSPWQPAGGGDATAYCFAQNRCPNEMFADGFSACATQMKPRYDYWDGWDVTEGYEMPWTPTLEHKLCRFIVKVGSEVEG